jgi:hypothetical protein
MVNEALAVQRARCVCAGGAFFTSPRLRGEVASILRAGEGESQAGPDSRMVPLTPILRCASSRTSPRKRGEVALDPVIASASEAIHGSASQDRRWIASSLRPAMTESNRPLQRRHHRACPGDPRPGFVTARKTWMAGTSARSKASSPRPAMTTADSRVNRLTATPPRSRGACPSFAVRPAI